MTTRVQDLLLGTQWAITQEYLEVMRSAAHREADLEAIERRLGRPLSNDRPTVRLRDDVAIVSLTGPLFRYANLFTRISGATSTEQFATEVGAALDDQRVRALVLEIDSPGGQVNGVSEVAQLIRSRRDTKPVVAFVSGLGASGAYWIAAAADRVVLADTAVVGSIGTVMSLRRGSERDEEITIVSSQSPKKRVDVETEEGREEVQSLLDSLADVFIDSVADYRSVSREKVLSDFGQGGVLVGANAVAAGMADGVGTLEGLIAEFTAGGARMPARQIAADRGSTNPEDTMSDVRKEPAADEQPVIDRAYLNARHQEIVAEIQAEAAAAERERILGIHQLPAKGFEALRDELAADPAVTKGEAALRLLTAREEKESAARQAHLDAVKADEKEGGKPAASADAETAEVSAGLQRLRQAEALRKGAAAPSRN